MKKDNCISIIRFLSLFMIISCHILQGLQNEFAFWLNLGVQIFFFMSGYLYGKKEIEDYKKFYKNRLTRILVPNIILIIVVLVIDSIFFNIHYSKQFLIANILGFGGFSGTLTSLSHTWFVSYILLCYLITPFLQIIFQEQKASIKTLFFLITTFILFELYHVTNINSAWIGNYILGYYFTKCVKTEKEQKHFFYIIFTLLIPMLFTSLTLKYQLMKEIPTLLLSFKNLICNWEHVLLGSVLFLLLYELFSHIKLKKNQNWLLSFSDKYSYFIYLTHQIFILNHMSILSITNHFVLNIFIIFVCSILSGILLYYINEKIQILGKKLTN